MFESLEILKVNEKQANQLEIEVPKDSGEWYVLKVNGFDGKHIFPGKPQKTLEDLKALTIDFAGFFADHYSEEHPIIPEEIERLKTHITKIEEDYNRVKNQNNEAAIRISKIALTTTMTGVGLQGASFVFDIYKHKSDVKEKTGAFLEDREQVQKNMRQNETPQTNKGFTKEQVQLSARYFSNRSSLNSENINFIISIQFINDSNYPVGIVNLHADISPEWAIEIAPNVILPVQIIHLLDMRNLNEPMRLKEKSRSILDFNKTTRCGDDLLYEINKNRPLHCTVKCCFEFNPYGKTTLGSSPGGFNNKEWKEKKREIIMCVAERYWVAENLSKWNRS